MTIKCKAKIKGEVKERGKSTVEWYKEGKPVRYCYGYKDYLIGELLKTCKNCKDCVIYAQEDLEKYKFKRSLK